VKNCRHEGDLGMYDDRKASVEGPCLSLQFCVGKEIFRGDR